ncbi:MAG: hypothetical protein ACRDRJ_15855 [Streptosporangiaceae bacterium]
MNDQAPPLQPASPPPSTKHERGRSPWPRRAAVAAVVIVALLAGVGIGAASNSHASALNTANARLATARRELAAERASNAALHSQASTLRTQYASAKNAAAHATSIANAKAKAAYANRNAALNVRSTELNQRARAIAATEGMLQSSKISSDGVYVVGRDIKPGTYHTNGDGGLTTNACYYATLTSTNTGNISDNNNFDGPETVDVSGAVAFQISGPCTWIRIG